MRFVHNECRCLVFKRRDWRYRVEKPDGRTVKGICGDRYAALARARQVAGQFRPGCGYVDTQGYVLTPTGYLHRELMARKLGRSLRTGEVVHDVNGDRLDNRIENLEVLSASAHMAHHNRIEPKRKRRQAVASSVATGSARCVG